MYVVEDRSSKPIVRQHNNDKTKKLPPRHASHIRVGLRGERDCSCSAGFVSKCDRFLGGEEEHCEVLRGEEDELAVLA